MVDIYLYPVASESEIILRDPTVGSGTVHLASASFTFDAVIQALPVLATEQDAGIQSRRGYWSDLVGTLHPDAKPRIIGRGGSVLPMPGGTGTGRAGRHRWIFGIGRSVLTLGGVGTGLISRLPVIVPVFLPEPAPLPLPTISGFGASMLEMPGGDGSGWIGSVAVVEDEDDEEALLVILAVLRRAGQGIR